MPNKKIKDFNDGFIAYQYQMIEEIIKQEDRLDLNDAKDRTLYTLLEGSILNLMFRLKGIVNVIKELDGEEIIIPEKYQKYFKISKELTYFKGDELMLVITDGEIEKEMPVNDLITKIKAAKNGQQTKKDDRTSK